MMTTAAYPATMTELKSEPAHSSLWSNYGGGSTTHLPGRLGGGMDSPFHGSARLRSGHEAAGAGGFDHPAYPYRGTGAGGGGYGPPQDKAGVYERHASYSSLKRSFSQAEPTAYQEMVQDLRDEGAGSRLPTNQDHRLLAFRRAQDKSIVVNQHGRVQQLDLSAQLHGMFFLSEMPSSGSDGTVGQPELTCYRRNLFQISGSLVMPWGQLSVVVGGGGGGGGVGAGAEGGEPLPVSNMEVAVSAIESVDCNPVRLIMIPWKTPPPNSPDISQAPDQEPPTLPLVPFQDDSGGGDSEGELAVYPIGWRRLQFRIATANNGRRKELQQHFVLHLRVWGTLADGTKAQLAEATTAPIVVRGRSPRNFQARKEIPLLGSSAGSRGQALVETGLGVVASALSLRHDAAKAARSSIDMQVPRSSFTFSPQKPPGGALSAMRSNSYPSWNPQVPPPPSSLGADAYPKLPLAGAAGFTTEPPELSLQQATSMAPAAVPGLPLSADSVSQPPPPPPLRSHFSSTSSSAPAGDSFSMPRYVDGGARPSKSPRQSGHQSVHSSGSVVTSNTDASSADYRYAAAARSDAPPPSTATWSSAEHSPSAMSVAYAAADARSYSFPSHESYKTAVPAMPPFKHDAGAPAAGVYGGGLRGSFDTMNNYSWSAA